MNDSMRGGGWLLTLALALALATPPALAQTARPAPVPSPSPAAPGPSQSPQLPAGADTGIPGTGAKPAYTGNVKGDNTPRKMLQQRRGTSNPASAPAVDDRAAAKAAARPDGKASAPAR